MIKMPCAILSNALDARDYVASANPLVSVTLLAYNAGETLRTAIESILDQSYPHFESIINDAGSDVPPRIE